MPTFSVNIKWNGKQFKDIPLNTDEPATVFKYQLFSLTGVDPSRQKVMVKGGMLKDDTDLKSLPIKEGHTFMMMGTVGEGLKVPEKPILFMEDMNDQELAQVLHIPPGLENLGNVNIEKTCYANSVLECFRYIPELQSQLFKYQGNANLTAAIRDLFKLLNNTADDVSPSVFLQVLRQVYPQFAQQQNGIYMQQDAQECWAQILSELKTKLKLESSKSFIEQYLTGETHTIMKCEDNPNEEATEGIEPFDKLDCHISVSTNYMKNGIAESLSQKIEKNSPSLGRLATYTKSIKISRLPKYLTVQFVRFFWKSSEQKKAKILRKVKFPVDFDASDLCTEDLRKKLLPGKERIKLLEDALLDKKKTVERQKSSTNKEKDVKLTKAERDALSLPSLDPGLEKDEGGNPTGQYRLIGVVTHMGRTADSGHYIGWVRQGDSDDWWKFDDDKVSPVKTEDIEKLDGGGDWHTAYICLYQAKET